MSNRPEYVCVWLGATKMGARTALINHNLKTDVGDASPRSARDHSAR
jgi:acyl-CoA synthetase (AMP-forming)/AMP-acid ligase II